MGYEEMYHAHKDLLHDFYTCRFFSNTMESKQFNQLLVLLKRYCIYWHDSETM